MTEIIFTFQKKNLIGIQSFGHSGYAEKGQDIICASVSTLMFSLILGLTEIAEIKNSKIEIDEENTSIKISWPESVIKEIKILILTVESSLRRIAKENPDYIKISEVFI